MKLGLILESPQNGTDHQVYEYVIKTLHSTVDVDVIGSRNKKELIDNCGKIAKTLLDTDHCNHVAIIWDLMPRWGGSPCRNEDVTAITKNLTDAGVDLSRIKLICIEPELEGWLIIEGSALTRYKKSIYHPHPVEKFNGRKVSAGFKDSKKMIGQYLERRYNDIVEAIKITKNIDDFGKIARKHKSFARLKTFIEKIAK